MNMMNKFFLLTLAFLFPLFSSAQSVWNDTMMVWFEAVPPNLLTEIGAPENLLFLPGETGDLVQQYSISDLNVGLGAMSVVDLKSLNAFFGTHAQVAIFADPGLNLWAGSNSVTGVRRLKSQLMPQKLLEGLLGEESKIGMLVFSEGKRKSYLYDLILKKFTEI